MGIMSDLKKKLVRAISGLPAIKTIGSGRLEFY